MTASSLNVSFIDLGQTALLTEEASCREERIVDKWLHDGFGFYKLRKSGDVADRLGRTESDVSAFLRHNGLAVADDTWSMQKDDQPRETPSTPNSPVHEASPTYETTAKRGINFSSTFALTTLGTHVHENKAGALADENIWL